MNPDQNQSPQVQQANSAAAKLSFSNTMMEHLLQYKAQKPQDASQSPQEPQGQPQPPVEMPSPDPRIDQLEAQFGALKDEVAKSIQDEIGQVKDMITQALKEDDKKD